MRISYKIQIWYEQQGWTDCDTEGVGSLNTIKEAVEELTGTWGNSYPKYPLDKARRIVRVEEEVVALHLGTKFNPPKGKENAFDS